MGRIWGSRLAGRVLTIFVSVPAPCTRRKFWMVFECKALIVAPGGVGTFDELFETMTLLQVVVWVVASCLPTVRILRLEVLLRLVSEGAGLG